MKEKFADWNAITEINEETIRLREEINMQYQALGEVAKLGDLYGVDVRKPVKTLKKQFNGLTLLSWLLAV